MLEIKKIRIAKLFEILVQDKVCTLVELINKSGLNESAVRKYIKSMLNLSMIDYLKITLSGTMFPVHVYFPKQFDVREAIKEKYFNGEVNK